MLSHAKSWHQVQGGTPNEIGYLGSNFFFRQALGNLPTYVIRHIDIYGNMTSSPPVLSYFGGLGPVLNSLRAIAVSFRLDHLLGSTSVQLGPVTPRKAGASRPATVAVKSWKYWKIWLYCTKSLSSSGAVTRDTADEIMVSTHWVWAVTQPKDFVRPQMCRHFREIRDLVDGFEKICYISATIEAIHLRLFGFKSADQSESLR